MLHALIFAAEALPIGDRSENAGAEKPVALRLKGPVIDGLGLGHFAMGPAPDFFRARQRDANRVKIGDQICTVVRRRTVHDISLNWLVPSGFGRGHPPDQISLQTSLRLRSRN